MGTPGKTTYLKGLFGSDTFLSFQVSGQYVPATRHIGAIFDHRYLSAATIENNGTK